MKKKALWQALHPIVRSVRFSSHTAETNRRQPQGGRAWAGRRGGVEAGGAGGAGAHRPRRRDQPPGRARPQLRGRPLLPAQTGPGAPPHAALLTSCGAGCPTNSCLGSWGGVPTPPSPVQDPPQWLRLST